VYLLRGYSDGLRAGRPGFDSRQGHEIFLFSIMPRPAVGSTHPPRQWVPGTVSPRVKRPRREADHLTPSSAQVKNDGVIPQLLHMGPTLPPSGHVLTRGVVETCGVGTT
jgi:hypothetical protein